MRTPAEFYSDAGEEIAGMASFRNLLDLLGMPETLPMEERLKYSPLALGLMKVSGADTRATQDKKALGMFFDALAVGGGGNALKNLLKVLKLKNVAGPALAGYYDTGGVKNLFLQGLGRRAEMSFPSWRSLFSGDAPAIPLNWRGRK